MNAGGQRVPVRAVGEQHVKDDLGFIPTVCDWLRLIEPQRWMRMNRTEYEARMSKGLRAPLEP